MRLALLPVLLLFACDGEPTDKQQQPNDIDTASDDDDDDDGDSTGDDDDDDDVPVCTPDETRACYTGDAVQIGVGLCAEGTETCAADGSGWGPCEDQVLPADETCDAGLIDEDCDGEVNEEGLDCACVPFATQDCYTGDPLTEDVGLCHGGTETCLEDGTGWGPCENEVLPTDETCATPDDEDCDGFVNEEGASCVCVPNEVDDCYTGDPLTEDVGVCTGGTQTCGSLGLSWGPCQDEVLPGTEDCLTFDDADCDGEVNEEGAGCICVPGTVEACYTGDPLTENVGACASGTTTCNADGLGWGPCQDEVLPGPEQCDSGDHDCNGVPDDLPDIDGDGWNVCEGDCCEETTDCSIPEAVNPGAFEAIGNLVDDDCDLSTPDDVSPPDCSGGVEDFSTTAFELAEAMELCQYTVASPPPQQRIWGVLDADLRRADGSVPSSPQYDDMTQLQTAVMTFYGFNNAPQKGSTMAGLSNGTMRDASDPGYVPPNPGGQHAWFGDPPADYLAAHGGNLQTSLGCAGTCPSGTGANDAVNLRLTIRVPTNAHGLSFHHRFYSSEYQTYACSIFNDFVLMLLDTSAPGMPADRNIAFDSLSNPISVNTGFFDVCQPMGCYFCPEGVSGLAGTGLEGFGGGTTWLRTTAPVVPGETIVLELMIFDVSDDVGDSYLLLDNFEWLLTPTGVGTAPPG